VLLGIGAIIRKNSDLFKISRQAVGQSSIKKCGGVSAENRTPTFRGAGEQTGANVRYHLFSAFGFSTMVWEKNH